MRKLLVPLKTATLAQLRAFNEQKFQLALDENAKAAEYRAALAAVWPKAEIEILVDEDEAAPIPVAKAARGEHPAESSRGDPLVRLQIPDQDRPGGKDPVPLSVNGKAMLIPRRIICDVPYRYFLALQAAVQTVYTPQEDGTNLAADVPNYGYNVHSMPSEAEVAAWEKRTQDIGRSSARAA